MTDLEIVSQIETELNKKLRIQKKFDFLKSGYILDDDDNVVLLSLNGIRIDNLPAITIQLIKLKYLKTLLICRCGLTNIHLLGELKNLSVLDISNNRIEDISAIENLYELSFLSLRNNIISDIFPLKNLNQLVELDISSNNLEDISALKYLTNLKCLDLSENKISDIKPLSKLYQLYELKLGENRVKNITPLASLISLKNINICYNKIKKISALKNLVNLKKLWLLANDIDDFTALTFLVKLEELSLGNMGITTITFLEKLVKLKRLDLQDNCIADISPLINCKQLKELNIGNNNIEEISALKNLKKIKNIQLQKNPIKYLPSWITDLNLEIVWDEYGYTYKHITFYENPLLTPPVEIVKEGTAAIKRYFEKINQEGVDYIYEAKLTFVGEGSAGKTSLQKRLMEAESELPAKDTRTRGIEITDWEFENGDGKNHIAHIWDFGGQDVYYPVHRFFITENSVFVLLASTRQTHHNFDYWIPTIYQFGGKSPIVLGQTCHDGNKISWNDLGVYLGNPNFNIIKTHEFPYYELNLPNQNEGLENLRNVITNQIVTLPRYGRGVPSSWVTVRLLLGEMAKGIACISFEKYKEICFASNPASFGNTSDYSDCCRFLHDIGVVLWYSAIDELKNWVILQPEWAMNAVYKIIDDSEIQTRRGNIIADDFIRLWNEKCYEEKHSILKSMLEVFKIAFPKKHIKGDYIIPARLLSMPNERKWKHERCLRLEYRYEFMPRGLVNQVSAELSRYIVSDDEVWNNAVNFSTENNTAQCQVEEDFYNRKIVIKAKGKDARSLIILVMNALRNITEGYKGVRPEIYVPCTCAKCKEVSLPTTFLYDKLLDWSANDPNRRVTCNESGDSMTIESLLYNVGLPNPNIPVEKKKKKIFISYSRKDVDYKNELKKHLKLLQTFDIADNWSCEEITIGKWNTQIQTALEESDLIVYMLSANFFTSKYILEDEVQKGIELIAKDNEKQILCVIVSDFVGIDKLKAAVKDSETNSLQDSLLQLGDYQYLPYSLIANSVTGNNEEKIIPLDNHPNVNAALKQITEKVLEFCK